MNETKTPARKLSSNAPFPAPYSKTLTRTAPPRLSDEEYAAHQTLIQGINELMSELETDINRRNEYINRRYEIVYKGGIMNDLRLKPGHDSTEYNFMPRIVDIHSAQLFGRPPQLVTTYDKEDLSIYDVGVVEGEEDKAKQEKEKARLRNARKATDASARNEAIKAIMRDNDFEVLEARAAKIGSWAGISVVKGWLDRKAGTYRFSIIEQPQNYMRYFTNSNFREHDADMYYYQMAESKAKRLWGKKLREGEQFRLAGTTYPWQKASSQEDLERNTIKNCWVQDFTGYVPGIKVVNGKPKECEHGEENRFSAMLVGGVIVQLTTKDLPTYWVVPNEEEAGNPWGRSDISDELIQVNQTMIETMSDWRTASWKLTFPKMKFMGFEDLAVPALQERTAQGFALGEGQDILPINMDNTLGEFPRLMQELWNSFTKLAKVGRVMLDDPTINPASNQGLMTTMKPLIDVTEDKQKRWGAALNDMFTIALKETASLDEALKEAIDEESWEITVKWPSVMRREDAAYQQMYMNRWNAGNIDVSTYIEAMGEDPSEIIDRLRDDMTDPIRAAMIGRGLPQMAQALLAPPAGPPEPKVSVNLRGDLTPSQEANAAEKYGFQDGSFGASMGPQGNQGLAAQENEDNVGFIEGNPYRGGMPVYKDAQGNPIPDAPNATLTPDQNTGEQSVSQPGSGAPAVSPQGAINQTNQRRGA